MIVVAVVFLHLFLKVRAGSTAKANAAARAPFRLGYLLWIVNF